MELSEILSKCDHTLLSPTATWEQIRELIDDGIKFSVASVCIPPSFVKKAKAYSDGRLPICTVIGFPLGYGRAKVEEAKAAVLDGADEIDTVINLGDVKMGNYGEIVSELADLREATRGKILKVIIETCLLTKEEKIRLCKIISDSGADYIKTSTGFSHAGATAEDIKLFSENIADHLKIKAAGGISSLEDAENFIKLGADRLGTSRIVKIAKSKN